MTKKTAEFRDNLVSPELKIIQSGKDVNHFSIIDRYTVLVHRANIHVADGLTYMLPMVRGPVSSAVVTLVITHEIITIKNRNNTIILRDNLHFIYSQRI